MDSVPAGDARGLVGGLAVLRARRTFDPERTLEYVHADRAGCWHGLDLQRGGVFLADNIPGPNAATRRTGHLFRSGGGHRRACAGGTSLGVASPRSDLERNQR